METKIARFEATATDVALGDIVSLEEVRLAASGITLRTVPSRSGTVADLRLTAVLSEAALNHAIAARPEPNLRDVEIALLTGRLRVSGRYLVLGAVPIPFAFTAQPTIDGGTRLRLDPQGFSVGPALVPGIGANMIGDAINARLSHLLDLSALGLPGRLSGVSVEPGRIIIEAQASIDVRPADTSVALTREEG